jgi:hypothetical protein
MDRAVPERGELKHRGVKVVLGAIGAKAQIPAGRIQ